MDDIEAMASALKRALMQAIPDQTERLHATLKVDEAVFLATPETDRDTTPVVF